MIVIDGEGCILGRLSAYVAKELTKGETVVVVNAEKIIVTGNMKDIVAKYTQRIGLRDIAKPVKSPHYPKRPDLFVKRTVRGMIPYRTRRGREMYRKMRTYMGVPKEYKDTKAIKVGERKSDTARVITVEKICKELGWG